MKTKYSVILVLALVFILVAFPVQAAKPGGEYLGKFSPGETVVFSWTTNPGDYAPKWSLYLDERDTLGYWKGLLRCAGCFEEVSPGVWQSSIPPYYTNDGSYMICAEYGEWGEETYEMWTYRIGGRGGKPVRSGVTSCP